MAISAVPSARALSALSHLASLGSLTQAAEQLGVTRSALSHRIAELERGLGVALVRKAGRKLVLTEEGERLLAGVGDALERIEVTISTTMRPVDLGREDIDAAIRHGRGNWKGLTSTLLFNETLMPIASPSVVPRWCARQGVPLIRARSRFMDWSRWEKSASAFPRRPKWLTVETRAQALDAAIAGAGIALMDMAYIGAHVRAGRLQLLAERPLQLPTGYYFVHAPRAKNYHLLTRFRDWVVEAAKPFRGAGRGSLPSS